MPGTEELFVERRPPLWGGCGRGERLAHFPISRPRGGVAGLVEELERRLGQKAVGWHAAALKSDNPESLRDHADQLWGALNDSDKIVGTFLKANRSGLVAASSASFAVLVFGVAAFIKAKGKDRTMPSSKSSQGLDG